MNIAAKFCFVYDFARQKSKNSISNRLKIICILLKALIRIRGELKVDKLNLIHRIHQLRRILTLLNLCDEQFRLLHNLLDYRHKCGRLIDCTWLCTILFNDVFNLLILLLMLIDSPLRPAHEMISHSESILDENLLKARITRTMFILLATILIQSIELLETSHIGITDNSFLALVAGILRCEGLEMLHNAGDGVGSEFVRWLMLAALIFSIEEICELIFVLKSLQEWAIGN